MSSIILQIGQCGNQIGALFWEKVQNYVNNLKNEEIKNTFIMQNNQNGHRYFHSINIDTEPRVIKLFQGATKLNFNDCIFRQSNIIYEYGGCGNNWAKGYYQKNNYGKENIYDRTMEEIRKETERCENYEGSVMLHSIGGGTGSGISSHLAELLKDEFPKNFLISFLISPMICGENSLQQFNSLLALSKLVDHLDAITIFSNDEILQRLQVEKNSINNRNIISMKNMNQNISECIAGALFPLFGISNKSYHESSIPYLIDNLSESHFMNQFYHINHVNSDYSTWENLLAKIHQPNKLYPNNYEFYSCDTIAIFRGTNTLPLTEKMLFQMNFKLREGYRIRKNNKLTFTMSKYDYQYPKADKFSITTISKNNNTLFYLKQLLYESQIKFQSKAFLHWYYKYGATVTDFHDAFETVDSLILKLGLNL